jgi:hypothetical protein
MLRGSAPQFVLLVYVLFKKLFFPDHYLLHLCFNSLRINDAALVRGVRYTASLGALSLCMPLAIRGTTPRARTRMQVYLFLGSPSSSNHLSAHPNSTVDWWSGGPERYPQFSHLNPRLTNSAQECTAENWAYCAHPRQERFVLLHRWFSATRRTGSAPRMQ